MNGSLRLATFVPVVALMLSACSGGGSTSLSTLPPTRTASDTVGGNVDVNVSLTVGTAKRINHVIIIVQENRTVDNLFNGFPGADTVQTGLTHDGRTVALRPESFVGPYDPTHGHDSWLLSYDAGKMDGFDLTHVDTVVANQPPPPPLYQYGYVPRSETVPYWALAQQFTFADRNFSSETGPSYPGHQYLIAGQSDYLIGDPNDPFFRWGCDAQAGTTTEQLDPNTGKVNPNGPFPCLDYPTLADLADAKLVSWRYYTDPTEKLTGSGVQPYDAIRHIRYGPDWNNVVTPQAEILTDLATGNLAAISWVNPPLIASDHAQTSTNLGPDWVATIVNAVAASPLWSSTAIFVTWDDWGLSFRVPLVVISPWARHRYVSHVQHEPGSILRFVEETFGLGSLATTDARADDLIDCFDFKQTPPPFAKISTRVSASFFLSLGPNAHPIDD